MRLFNRRSNKLVLNLRKALTQKSISVVRSCLVRVTSWIVPFVQKTKDDPRSHTNQHESKHSRLELDPTFEAKLLRTTLIDLNLKSFAYQESLCFNPRRLVSVIAQMRLGRTCVL
jgi:hypothetical protein